MPDDSVEWSGEQIAALHDPDNGVDWEKVCEITGLTLGQARSRKARYVKSLFPDTVAGDDGEPADQVVTVDEAQNKLIVTTRATAIKTEADLVRECSIDETIWKRTAIQFNAWTTPAKADDGAWMQIQNYQVKARYVRRNPEPLFPVIQPVECPVTYHEPEQQPVAGLLRSLVVCDPQIGYRRDFRSGALTPFHDRRALDLALQIAVAADVDRVDVLGDYLDMTEWTDRFTAEPAFYQTTQPAVLEGHWWLRQFREARPNAEIAVLEGNHEARMTRALMTHLPAAYGLRAADELELPPAMSLPKLLALQSIGVRWRGDYPDEMEWLNDELGFCHGDVTQSAPGGSARAVAEQKRATVVFGHVHRREMATVTWHTRLRRIEGTGICPGCLCHVDGRVPGKRAAQNWQQGLAVLDYDPSGQLYSVTVVPIDQGAALWSGQRFVARDATSQLRADLPEWNWGE